MNQGTRGRKRQLMTETPTKDQTMQLSEDDLSRELLLAGQDPTDPLQRALFREALAASKPRNPASVPKTLTGRIRAATGLSHTQIADVIGASRSLMQAYDSGRAREMYSAEDMRRLRSMVARRQTELSDLAKSMDKALEGSVH
jgi:DNA-binding transcriptional regulator YiaG